MVPQILSRLAIENHRLVGHSDGLTSAYTGLFKSLASALNHLADDSQKHGRERLTY